MAAGEGAGAGAEMDALIRRLRLHQAGPSPYDPAPAATPVADGGGGGELFRPRRAAVLLCLFRGAAGELRVILTKRSSTLSAHSGERLDRFLACPSSVLCLFVFQIENLIDSLVVFQIENLIDSLNNCMALP